MAGDGRGSPSVADGCGPGQRGGLWLRDGRREGGALRWPLTLQEGGAVRAEDPQLGPSARPQCRPAVWGGVVFECDGKQRSQGPRPSALRSVCVRGCTFTNPGARVCPAHPTSQVWEKCAIKREIGETVTV